MTDANKALVHAKAGCSDAELLRTFVHARALHPAEAEQAFEALVQRHAALVQGVCMRTLRNRAVAEDAAQAVFMVLAKKAAALVSHPSLSGWLYRTARFVAARAGRMERNRGQHEVAGQMPDEPGRKAVVDTETLESLRKLVDVSLERLSARDREVIVLHDLEEVSQAEAAQALGISHEAFRQRLSRAMERLRNQLAGRGAVVSSLMLGPALSALSLADGKDAAVSAKMWTHVALGKSTNGTHVLSIAKGALDAMWTKHVLTMGALGLSVCLLLAGAGMYASEQSPLKPELAGKASKGIEDSKLPVGPPVAADVFETHINLPVLGLSRPVFSPDGCWMAAREGADRLVLIEMARLLQDPKGYVPHRMPCEAMLTQGNGEELGSIVAFAADSKSAIFRAPQGLTCISLPPVQEAKEIPLRGTRVPFIAASTEKIWALLDTNDEDPHVKSVSTTRPVRVVFYKENADGTPLRQNGPEIIPQDARWTSDGKALLARLQDQTIARIDPQTGKAQPLVGLADFEKAFGQAFDRMQLVDARPNGALLVKGTRTHPNKKGVMPIGAIFYPEGSEKPERGEPPPFGPSTTLASYLSKWENGKLSLVELQSVYRGGDHMLALPTPGWGKFFAFEQYSFGRFERWEAFAGSLDASGKKTLLPLKGVPEGRTQWLPLDVSKDGAKALFLIKGTKSKLVKFSNDPMLLEDLRKTHKIVGISGAAADRTLEGMYIVDKYERSGSAHNDDGVTMSFGSLSVGLLDGDKGAFTYACPELIESVGEFKDAPGIPGRSLSAPRYEWSSAAGYLAMVLVKDRTTSTGEDKPAGLVLIRIPAM